MLLPWLCMGAFGCWENSWRGAVYPQKRSLGNVVGAAGVVVLSVLCKRLGWPRFQYLCVSMFVNRECGSIKGKCGVIALACKEPTAHKTKTPNPLLQSKNGNSLNCPCFSVHAFLALVTVCHETEYTAQLSAWFFCAACVPSPEQSSSQWVWRGKGGRDKAEYRSFTSAKTTQPPRHLLQLSRTSWLLGCLQVLVCLVMYSTWLAIVSYWWRRLFSPLLRSSQPFFFKPCLFSLCDANYFLFVESLA